jgi:hypothetical protein
MKILVYHKWDEMTDRKRKAITFALFNHYLFTFYWGKGKWYNVNV